MARFPNLASTAPARWSPQPFARWPVGPFATGTQPWNVTLSPNGKYVYVANHGTLAPAGMTISQYAVNAATGALTSLNSATLPSAFRYPDDITVDLTSSFAYLSNINGNTIFEYGIGADGTLGRANPASVAAGTVSQYAVGTAGQLTPLVPSTVLAGTGPGWIAFDPFRKYVYVVNIGNGTPPGIVSKYAIGTGGALTLIGTATAGVNVFMIATAY